MDRKYVIRCKYDSVRAPREKGWGEIDRGGKNVLNHIIRVSFQKKDEKNDPNENILS